MSVVHHEGPGYVYEPTGLMAEDWGKTGHRTEVPAAAQESHLFCRRIMDNDRGRDAMEYVWSLDDKTILGACAAGSPEHREVMRRIGGKTNPYWVTSQAGETAYIRGLIGEAEIDRIMDL